MKYCHGCHKITLGEPLFCTYCGSSYDTKLCASLHPNPRFAKACSACGKRDFSRLQPKVPALLRFPIWLFGFLPKLLVIAFTLGGTYVLLHRLFSSPNFVPALVCVVLIAAVLGFLWSKLPRSLQWMLRMLGRVLLLPIRLLAKKRRSTD